MDNVLIKDATPEDAVFIAGCVLSAVGVSDFDPECPYMDELAGCCRRSDTLYSFRNARIALVDGVRAGSLVSYKGDDYLTIRRITAETISDTRVRQSMTDSEPETRPGEFYLDSMAVHPSFRGLGLSRLLISDAIERGRAAGCTGAAIIVDVSREVLKNYYSSFGFTSPEEITFMGHRYCRMTMKY